MAPGIESAVGYGKYDQSLAQNLWKRWTWEEAVVAYIRMNLSIAQRADLLKCS